MNLPKNPTDGQTISSSNIRYFSTLNEWANAIDVKELSIVDFNKNGLLSPQMALLLNNISKYKHLKFANNTDNYYYMLNNKHIISNIINNNLTLEIDRSWAINNIAKFACAGPKGDTGDKGNSGNNGSSGPLEISHVPNINDNVLNLTVTVDAPLDTEISIRGNNNDKTFEIWYYDGSWSTISSDISIDSSSTVSLDDDILNINLISDEWNNDWVIKVRQRGPTGFDGIDGTNFISISNSVLNTINAIEFVTNLRKSRNNNMFFIKQSLNDLPTFKLKSIPSKTNDLSSNSNIIAVEPSIDSNKLIRKWSIVQLDNVNNQLNLPNWLPDKSCTKGVSYKWYDNLIDLNIQEADDIPIKCCQEDFYFCPSTGSTNCDVESNGVWQWPPINPKFDSELDAEIWSKSGEWVKL